MTEINVGIHARQRTGQLAPRTLSQSEFESIDGNSHRQSSQLRMPLFAQARPELSVF
jgi:hypothetical protein